MFKCNVMYKYMFNIKLVYSSQILMFSMLSSNWIITCHCGENTENNNTDNNINRSRRYPKYEHYIDNGRKSFHKITEKTDDMFICCACVCVIDTPPDPGGAPKNRDE